jgi:hypothetical protein
MPWQGDRVGISILGRPVERPDEPRDEGALQKQNTQEDISVLTRIGGVEKINGQRKP